MNSTMYRFALLLSDESPFFKAILEDENEPRNGKALRSHIFSVTYDSMKSWANGSKKPTTTSIKKLVEGMNAYRKERRQAKHNSKRFEVSDFRDSYDDSELTSSSDFLPAGQKAEWLDFSIKLGYKPEQWRKVQHDIEQVFYRIGVRGHESSCGMVKGRQIVRDCGGINYLYFISPPATADERNDRPMLVRATLRVRDPVRVLTENDICYTPCRMKLITPSRDKFERNKHEYVGKAYFQSGFLYLSLVDKVDALDYIHMIVDLSKPYGTLYGGIYTSLSGSKKPYSSALVLDNREKLLSKDEVLDRELTLNFMYQQPKTFTDFDGDDPSSVIHTISSTDKLSALDESQKKHIHEILRGSPFVPNIKHFRPKV